MLAHGTSEYLPIGYVECPASALAVPAAGYDVATCQQGLQFVGDRQRALREMRKALRLGGRLGIAVWCAIDQCPPFAALAAALAQAVGEQAAAAYRNGPWGLASSGLAAQVEQAGFTILQGRRDRLPVTFDGGPDQLLQALAASGIAAQVAALDHITRRALAASAEEAASPFTQDGPYVPRWPHR